MTTFIIDDVPSDCEVSEIFQDGWIATTEPIVETLVYEGEIVYILFGNCPPVITVEIDIKPNSNPNSINTNSMGKVPVAILGSESLAVTETNPSSSASGPDGATPVHLQDGFLPADHYEDVNDYGFWIL